MLRNLAILQVGYLILLLTAAHYWPALQNDPADKLGEQGFDSETQRFAN
jgi:hypothetical protein